MSDAEALLQGLLVAAAIGLVVWAAMSVDRLVTWSRRRGAPTAPPRTRRQQPRRLLASALFDVFFSLGCGFFLLTIGSAAGCGAARAFHLVDVRGRAAPGGVAVFSAVDTGQSSIKGLYRHLGGTFTLEQSEAATLAVPTEWRVVMEQLHRWGRTLSYDVSRFSEEERRAPLKRILLSGQIAVPDAAQLAGRTIKGTLTIYYVFPFQTGDRVFDDRRKTLAVPFMVQVLSPSRLRWLVERAYILSGTGGTAVFLWATLTFLCVVVGSRVA